MIITNNKTPMITREDIEEEIKLFALFIDSNKNIEEVHLEHSFAEILRPHSKRIQRLDYIVCESENELFYIAYQDGYTTKEKVIRKPFNGYKTYDKNDSYTFEVFNEKSGNGNSILNFIGREFYSLDRTYRENHSFSYIADNLFLINKRMIERELKALSGYSKENKEPSMLEIARKFISEEICNESATFIKSKETNPRLLIVHHYIRDNSYIYKITTIWDNDDFVFDDDEWYLGSEIQTYKLGSGDIIEDFDLEASEEAFDLLLMMEL